MSNSGATPGDPFGVGEDVVKDMAALEEQGGGPVSADDGDSAPPKKTGPGGIPMPALIGIGAFATFMVVVIIVVIIAKLGDGGGGRQAAMKAEAERRAALDAAQQITLRTQLQEAQDAIKALQDSQNAMAAQLKKAQSSQDVQTVEQRVVRTEGAVRQLSNDIAAVSRRVADSQPFEAEMYMREDLRILSIGNGIARVVDDTGHEFTLQRGDRWSGLRVIKVRADRRQITFSDGSVAS